MVFSSPRFFLFLALLLLALAPRLRLATKLNILLLSSCFFYAAWDWRYLGLLLLVSAVNYECGRRIHATERPRVRQGWLLVSLFVSLGTLAWFKYTNFLLDTFRPLFGTAGLSLPELEILLPAGISFYTFKAMSYTIDIHRRELAPARSLTDYATFMTFFPELIAGPIVRASVFLPQMSRPIGPTLERLKTGFSIFLLGLSKKLLIADHMASVADPIFADPGLYAPATLWMGVLAYTFQIYCDFSGYSDMAVGTAKMIGYDLPENFRLPYLARDVSDFWRRWHVTLSTWLRDYLYVPLGGNRAGAARTYVNLMLTMLLGGLWHGSSWNFVLWGALHGGALAVHRAARAWTGHATLLPTPFAQAVTFLFVLLCWVPFRAPDFPTTLTYLSRMFQPGIGGVLWVPSLLGWAVGAMLVAHAAGAVCEAAGRGDLRARGVVEPVLSVFGAELRQDPISGWYIVWGLGRVAGALLLSAWLLLLYFYAPTGVSPFIYFQF